MPINSKHVLASLNSSFVFERSSPSKNLKLHWGEVSVNRFQNRKSATNRVISARFAFPLREEVFELKRDKLSKIVAGRGLKLPSYPENRADLNLQSEDLL